MLFLLVYNITMIHKYNRLKNRFEICLIHLAPPYIKFIKTIKYKSFLKITKLHAPPI